MNRPAEGMPPALFVRGAGVIENGRLDESARSGRRFDGPCRAVERDTSTPVPVLLITASLAPHDDRDQSHPRGSERRRLAAVVNDFGAINIDAELVTGASEGVVGLSNGCICCFTARRPPAYAEHNLWRDPPPDGIVIEASGVSDPADIVRSLLDPAIWRSAPLDAVVCLADGRQALDEPQLAADPLYRARSSPATSLF